MEKFIFILLLALINYNLAFRIILLPTPFVSHMNYFEPLAVELHESGHDTYMILSDAFRAKNRLAKKGLNILTYDSKGVCEIDTEDFFKKVTMGMIENGGDPGVLGKIVAPAMESECSKFLLDENLLETGRKLKFDLAIVDGLFFARFSFLFYFLSIPLFLLFLS